MGSSLRISETRDALFYLERFLGDAVREAFLMMCLRYLLFSGSIFPVMKGVDALITCTSCLGDGVVLVGRILKNEKYNF